MPSTSWPETKPRNTQGVEALEKGGAEQTSKLSSWFFKMFGRGLLYLGKNEYKYSADGGSDAIRYHSLSVH